MITTSIIKALDSQTINKIAAGEIIERPASVIKECIENSIDAHADTIVIYVEQGGQTLIRLTDNGTGIYKDDLEKAHLRHYTSKITRLDDIYGIDSFGFRGEALAAICHAGHVTIESKTAEDQGYKITIHNGEASELEPTSHPKGTTVSIQHLFEDIPVRLKFLKKPGTEFAYIYDLVTQFSLIHPTINFKLFHNQEEALNTNSIASLDQLALLLFGKKLHLKTCTVDFELDMIRIQGIISDPTLTFSNRTKQICAINGRLVKNATLLKAIETVFVDYIPARRFPLVVLNISIQSNELDINVHPQKLDFKFSQMGLLFNSVCQAIKGAIKATRENFNPDIIPQRTDTTDRTVHKIMHTPSSGTPKPTSQTITPSIASPTQLPLSQPRAVSSPTPPTLSPSVPITPPSPQPLISSSPTRPTDYLQILNTYILLKSDHGFYMIDQHAVHERILYEKFKAQARTQSDQQRLLIPEVVEASPIQFSAFESHLSVFQDLLFDIEVFGKQELMVRAIPIAFVGSTIQALILDLLDHFVDIPHSTPEIMNAQKEKLQMRACKAAIKAGQTLSELEIRQLCADLLDSPNNYTCPHGRPLFIEYTKGDLEKLFLRV